MFPSEILGDERISLFWRSGLKVRAEPHRGHENEGLAREGSFADGAAEVRVEAPKGINSERKGFLFSLGAGKGLGS